MTYINALEERRLLMAYVVGWSPEALVINNYFGSVAYWLLCSPIADNLTATLLLCAVVMKVAANDNRFMYVMY